LVLLVRPFSFVVLRICPFSFLLLTCWTTCTRRLSQTAFRWEDGPPPAQCAIKLIRPRVGEEPIVGSQLHTTQWALQNGPFGLVVPLVGPFSFLKSLIHPFRFVLLHVGTTCRTACTRRFTQATFRWEDGQPPVHSTIRLIRPTVGEEPIVGFPPHTTQWAPQHVPSSFEQKICFATYNSITRGVVCALAWSAAARKREIKIFLRVMGLWNPGAVCHQADSIEGWEGTGRTGSSSQI